MFRFDVMSQIVFFDHVIRNQIPSKLEGEFYSNINQPEVQLFELSDTDKKTINYDILATLNAFSTKQFSNITPIKGISFEGGSMWFYHKFRLYFELRNLTYTIKSVEELSKKDDTTLYTTSKLLGQYFNGTEINVEVIPSKQAGKTDKTYFLFFILRAFLGFFQLAFLSKKDYAVLEYMASETTLLTRKGKMEKGNYLTKNLSDELENKITIQDLTPPKKGKAFPKKYFKAIKLFDRENLYSEAPLLWSLLMDRSKIKNDIHQFNKTLNLISSLGNKQEQLICAILKSYQGSSWISLNKYYAFSRVFKKGKIKHLICYNEYGPASRPLIDAAKKHQIPSVALQHGTIHDLHPGYVYAKEEAAQNNFPDLNLIWGTYWQNLLTQFNHPPASLAITGQLRTDVIPWLLKEIQPVKPYIIYASQPQRDEELRDQILKDVIIAAQQLKDIQLVVRPHPNEQDDAYFLNIAKSVGENNLHINRQTDLYELIAGSQGLITCFSTVGLETTYFGKLLWVIDYLKQDLQGYIKAGVGIPIYQKSDLEASFTTLNKDELKISKDAYESFVNEYAYKIDGKVTERCLEAIQQTF